MQVSTAIMPSRYSSEATQQDARALAAALGVRAHELPIEPVDGAPTRTRCAIEFAGREPDLTEENLQARIRGNLLMALSNKFGWLVLATGNKSEMSVGYTTLYGDLAGGFAVIKDVPKTLVYRLCEWRNSAGAGHRCRRACSRRGRRRAGARSPARSSSAPPPPSCATTSATRTRCRPTRCSTAILEGYVELDQSREQLIAQGLPEPPTSTARSASWTSPSTSAARRRPESRSRPRAFGRDRRMPITNRYRG